MRQLAACAALALIPAAGDLQAAATGARHLIASHENTIGTTISSVSVVPSAGGAEIVIGSGASVQVVDFALASPHRVVIDLSGATIGIAPRYDRLPRGGVVNVRAAQFKPNVVRVVIEMTGPHQYEVVRRDDQVHVIVSGGAAAFNPWHSSPEVAARFPARKPAETRAPSTAGTTSSDAGMAKFADNASPAAVAPPPAYSRPAANEVPNASVTPDVNISREQPADRSAGTNTPESGAYRLSPPAVISEQARITVTYQDAEIRDVIAAFAAFSGRTIVVGKDVAGSITAEIRNQPWDVALRAILQGQGLAAAEDALSGIITVDSYRNIASKQASEPLVTQLVAVNYASAASLVQTLTGLLSRDCTPGGVPEAQQIARTSCFTRGAIAADTATNTLLITETPSKMGDLLSYVRNLDVRTPQVAIKAKIIFINRTDIQELGLSYDFGTGNDQFFSQLVQRIDPTTTKPIDTNGDGVPDSFGGGTPVTGDRVLLGGNALSAIANANARVVNPAL